MPYILKLVLPSNHTTSQQTSLQHGKLQRTSQIQILSLTQMLGSYVSPWNGMEDNSMLLLVLRLKSLIFAWFSPMVLENHVALNISIVPQEDEEGKRADLYQEDFCNSQCWIWVWWPPLHGWSSRRKTSDSGSQVRCPKNVFNRQWNKRNHRKWWDNSFCIEDD